MSKRIKIMGEGKTTFINAEAVNNGADTNIMTDKYGRLVMVPYTIRDLMTTATATLTNGTVTVLAAGVTGMFLDLVNIDFANNSGAAVTVTLSDDGTDVRSYVVPASTTPQTAYDYSIPIPQNAAGGAWRLDMPDISGTTVVANALFIKNK